MRPAHLVLPAAALAVAIAGCGSGSSSSSSSSGGGSTATTSAPASSSSGGGGAASTVHLSADPSGALKFNTTKLTAKAGKVTIVMSNPSSVTHAIAVEGNGVDQDGQGVQQGGTSKVTVTLKPGKYEFYCPIDGHEQAGMKGTLTVT